MPRRTRVALITYAMYGGGVETYVIRLGQALTKQGFDVEVITTVTKGKWYPKISEAGLKSGHINGFHPNLQPRKIARYIIAHGFDAVLINHAKYAQTGLGLLPNNIVAIPILHNDHPEVVSVGCANPTAWNVAVAVSPGLTELVRKMVPSCLVRYVPVGVGLPSDMELAARPQLKDSIKLIYVGRIDHDQKGVLFLPEILNGCLQRGLDASLTIIGNGADEDKLNRRLDALKLRKRVDFRYQMSLESVYDSLLNHHILLMPSQFEGLGVVMVEAMAHGCVPIASRLHGVTDTIIDEGTSGYLAGVGDVEGFVDSVAALAEDPARWRKMSIAGGKKAASEYSVQMMGKLFAELIQDALDGKYPLPEPRSGRILHEPQLFSPGDYVPFWMRLPVAVLRNRIARRRQA